MILLCENNGDNPYYEYIANIDERSIVYDFISNPNGKMKWKRIPFSQYKQALEEFVKYGKFMRFPAQKIYQWMGYIMYDTAQLRACTILLGHDVGCWDGYEAYEVLQPYLYLLNDEEEYDGPRQNQNSNINHPKLFDDSEFKVKVENSLTFEEYIKILFKMGFYDYSILPDGSYAISDYGIQPIEELISEYDSDMCAEEVIVLINKILDVTHQRGDLASMFIEGGSRALNQISYNENKKRKTVIISENKLKLITEKIILEAMSLPDIHQKFYSNIPEDDFIKIIQSDPTYKDNKMGNYGKWLLNLYINDKLKLEDLYKAKEYLAIFTKFINKIENKDINKYKSLPELYETIKPFEINPNQTTSNSEEVRKIKEGAEKVYEDNEWLVVVPFTKEAACYYGKGTKWCTASSDNDYENNMFDYYNEQGKLYININKKTNRKYQFFFNGYESQFMDETDNEIIRPVPQTINMSEGLIEYYKDSEMNYVSYLYFDNTYSIIDDGMSIENPRLAMIFDGNGQYCFLYSNRDGEIKILTPYINVMETPSGALESINGLFPIENLKKEWAVYDVNEEDYFIPFGDYKNMQVISSGKYWVLYGERKLTIVNTETKQITVDMDFTLLGGRQKDFEDVFFQIDTDFTIIPIQKSGLQGVIGFSLLDMRNGNLSEPIIELEYYHKENGWFYTNDIYENDIKINTKTGEIIKIDGK